MTDENRMRRHPRQARSQQRVDHILDTAALVFREVGFEAATTNAIAHRAEVPIGSLYQFFPNKESIMEALVARYTSGLRALYGQYLGVEATAGQSITAVLQQMVQAIGTFDAAHAAFRPFLLTSGHPATDQIHRELLSTVQALFASRFPDLPAARLPFYAQISVGIVKGLMNLSGPPDALPASQVGEEIVCALTAYLRNLLLREGLPLPHDLV